MKIVIFGSGPMPCEPQFAVTAPGARTWQVVQTAAEALRQTGDADPITVFGLEPADRRGPVTVEIPPVDPGDPPFPCMYYPLGYEKYIQLAQPADDMLDAVHRAECVIGCASLQPCSTASAFARHTDIPFWADLFGDCFAELQTRAEQCADHATNNTTFHHAWKLLLPVLLGADMFSALSERQRYAVMGQLGIAGRLNRFTGTHDLIHTVPFGLFPADFPPQSPLASTRELTIAWSGSFNTWMDSATLVQGLEIAFRAVPDLHLLVQGGRVQGYSEKAYDDFVEGTRKAGLEERLTLLDWQPLARTRELYSQCNAGLSIDRYSYEALLGSRTRVVNFLASGMPVISTVVTELTEELAAQGYVIPFELNNPESLAQAISTVAASKRSMQALGAAGRKYVANRFDGRKTGSALIEWLKAPALAPDKIQASASNPLLSFWKGFAS